ncbi:MAG: helix-turn-helix transcriptional regulator [Candidatus Omnitrophica bacterium]|nr:helix-turn-helix transcriptional regulator [Candidatus Omnitrophota bacterium]
MFAQKIRQLRNKKGLSQEKLARLANISFITVVKIESGESKHPTIQTMAGIAKALSVSLDELIKGI